MKENKRLVIIITILCLLLVLLGGYIIYDKVLNNKNSNVSSVNVIDLLQGYWYDYNEANRICYITIFNKDSFNYGIYQTDGADYGEYQNIEKIDDDVFKIYLLDPGCNDNSCLNVRQYREYYVIVDTSNISNAIIYLSFDGINYVKRTFLSKNSSDFYNQLERIVKY